MERRVCFLTELDAGRFCDVAGAFTLNEAAGYGR
jgi:hypothetical protein